MSELENKIWFYATSSEERTGPVSIRHLAILAENGGILPATLVWKAGYPEWVPAREISNLLNAAQAAGSAIQPPPAEPAPGVSVTRIPVSTNEERVASEVALPVAAVSSPILPREIKPRKGSFLFPRMLKTLLLSGVLGVVVFSFLAAAGSPAWPGLLVIGIGILVGAWASLVAYRKEIYQIHDTRVICRRGGIVSDETTELEIRKITHVKIKLPWLRFKFFGVGDVIVETAGNSKPVVMHAIHEPESIYAGMRERMKKNGYDLTQEKLLYEEKPAIIGILAESFSHLMAAVFLSIFLVSFITEAMGQPGSAAHQQVVAGLLALIGLALILTVTLRFLDFRRRTYRVYNDVVVYEEGFLTRENAFIPYENLADSNTKCSLFDRIFDLYDVQVSCQGSGSEIKFRRLKNGPALSAAIDQLVAVASQKPKQETRSAPGGPAAGSRKLSRRADPECLQQGESWVADLGMSPARVLLPLLVLFPMLPVWILTMVSSGVLLASTRYAVRPGSLRHSFRFLTVSEREFAYDKITGFVIRENLWDRMFGTMTLKFWSIGSGKALVFAHVRRSQVDLPALMRQVGIPPASTNCRELKASFGVMTWLRARLTAVPLLLLIIAAITAIAYQIDPALYGLLALPALLCVGGVIHAMFYYSRQRLEFHDHHVEAEQGIIVKNRFHVRYANVKRITATRYPGGQEGRLEIFAAAEEEVQQSIQKPTGKNAVRKQCSFTSGMLPDIRETGQLLDGILCGKIEASDPAPENAAPDVLLESPRSVGTEVARLVLLSIVIFPLIVLLPVTIPLTILRLKRWRYRIEDARIVVSRGILFRSETSVLLERVDSLKQSQGPLNKLFRNGKVSIMTAGSSKPDLIILDSPDYFKIYQEIRQTQESA